MNRVWYQESFLKLNDVAAELTHIVAPLEEIKMKIDKINKYLRKGITIMEITGRALHFLRKYGWSEERNVDISEYVNLLEKNGYVVFDCVKEFLRNFGGLYLMPSTNWSEVYKKENKDGAGYDLRACYVHFDVLVVPEAHSDSSCNKRYEARIGEKLVPIGQTEKGYISLMMSETGRVFGVYEAYMGLYGNNYVEALETIYWDRGPKEIPGIKEIEDAIQWDANRDYVCSGIYYSLGAIMKQKMRIKKKWTNKVFSLRRL